MFTTLLQIFTFWVGFVHQGNQTLVKTKTIRVAMKSGKE